MLYTEMYPGEVRRNIVANESFKTLVGTPIPQDHPKCLHSAPTSSNAVYIYRYPVIFSLYKKCSNEVNLKRIETKNVITMLSNAIMIIEQTLLHCTLYV